MHGRRWTCRMVSPRISDGCARASGCGARVALQDLPLGAAGAAAVAADGAHWSDIVASGRRLRVADCGGAGAVRAFERAAAEARADGGGWRGDHPHRHDDERGRCRISSSRTVPLSCRRAAAGIISEGFEHNAVRSEQRRHTGHGSALTERSSSPCTHGGLGVASRHLLRHGPRANPSPFGPRVICCHVPLPTMTTVI